VIIYGEFGFQDQACDSLGIFAVGFSAYSLLDMARPGVGGLELGDVYEGMEITEGMMLFFVLFWLIPFAMAFLSQTMKGSAIRWVNIMISIFFATIWIIDMVEGGLLQAQYLLNVSMIVVAALIVKYAWKWPRE